MKTDKSQDKYNEIFRELREEKMNWDFEDFLAEAEKEKKLTTKISENNCASFPKFYWMAASVVLLVSMGVFYNVSNQNKMDEQDQLVKNEILNPNAQHFYDSNIWEYAHEQVKMHLQKGMTA